MFRSYIKTAFRGFLHHKLFTFINIIGLSIGISAALVIYCVVHFDLSFDRSYPDSGRIYRVVSNFGSSKQRGYSGGVRGPLAAAVRKEMTGLEESAPFFIIDEFTLYHTGTVIPGPDGKQVKWKYTPDVILADEHYFNIFPYTWLAGSKTSLNKPFTVVLTAQKAKKYFPDLSYQQMLGRSVIYGDSIITAVAGIVEEHKGNTDFHFTDFISYSTEANIATLSNNLQLTAWGGITPSSQFFVKLAKGASATTIEKQLNDLQDRNLPKERQKTDFPELHLQKLSDIHFEEQYSTFYTRTADRAMLNGLLVIAAILLLLGSINFINLNTAQATQRAKEIGVRKTMGSSRGQLRALFLQETFLVTLFAVLIACLVAPLLLKSFADLIPEGVTLEFFHGPDTIIFLLCLTIGVSLCAGFYPSWVLSSFKPVDVLKNGPVHDTGSTRILSFRKSLTVGQFVIAQFFIMMTLMVSKQIHYALHKDLGFKKDAIVSISAPWAAKDPNLKQVFLNDVRSLPGVETVSLGGAPPSSDNTHSQGLTYFDGKDERKVGVQERFGDKNYIKVYGIPLLAGRDIGLSDPSKEMLVNASCVRAFGFKRTEDAVGKTVGYNGMKMQIAGVIGDFYYRSLHSPIEPMVIVNRSDNSYFSSTLHIGLKAETAGSEWSSTLALMRQFWIKLYPDDDFDLHFFDQDIARFYAEEQRTSTLLNWATGLSIVISCLGLLGLTIYNTNRRTKEIGIRKVIGASAGQIVALLTTDMLRLVLLGLAIACPIGWLAMDKWMGSFADRTPISWWIFILSGGGMIVAALFTMSFLTLKAAVSNPVESLRTE